MSRTQRLYTAVERAGGFAALRWLNRVRVPILCYHSVTDRELPRELSCGGLHAHVRSFEQQIAAIARHYEVVPLEDVIATLQDPPVTRRPRLALTFDDGYANNLWFAAPILERLDIPATIFLATDYIDTGTLFWWDELALIVERGRRTCVRTPAWGPCALQHRAGVQAVYRRGQHLLAAADLASRRRLLNELSEAVGGSDDAAAAAAIRPATWSECRSAPPNIRFGPHGAAHLRLDRVPHDVAVEDMVRCVATLRARLARATSSVFCYPHGASTPGVWSALRASGFSAAVSCTDSPRVEAFAERTSAVSSVPRIGVSARMNARAVVGHAAGFRILLGRLLAR